MSTHYLCFGSKMQTNLMCIPQGPVVQNFVSLTLSAILLTIYRLQKLIHLFLLKIKLESQRILTFFQRKITIVFVILPFDILTNRYR